VPNTLSYVEEIYVIMEKGQFPEINQERSEAETVVGEMTSFEKAVWTWIIRAEQKLDAFKREVEKEKNLFSMERQRLTDAVHLKATLDAMRPALWEIIEERLGIDVRKTDTGLRKGYLVVTYPREEDQNKESSKVRDLSVIIIGLGSRENSMVDDMLLGKPEGKPS
jgi:hypothetical protein